MIKFLYCMLLLAMASCSYQGYSKQERCDNISKAYFSITGIYLKPVYRHSDDFCELQTPLNDVEQGCYISKDVCYVK